MRNPGRAILFIIFLMFGEYVMAQDPKLPGANLGFSNMGAGRWNPPGWYYGQYLQVSSNTSTHDESGEPVPGPKLTSIFSLQQIIFVSKLTVLNGNVGFNGVLPLSVTTGSQDQSVTVNPNPLGDIAFGPFLEWQDEKLLGVDLFYRFGVNVIFPTGSFKERFDINPGSHRYRIFPNFQFTVVPLEKLAISVKQNLYFYSREIGSPKKSAAAYNLNYALEYTLAKGVVVEAAGYYLNQLSQDSYNGDRSYYKNNDGIADTRERIFGMGPGLGYTTLSKLSLELKTMWETGAKNRTQGFRTTLVLACPL